MKIALEACNGDGACSDDFCCDYDTVIIPVRQQPTATCPSSDTLFLCTLDTTICLEGFFCEDADSSQVIGGTLNHDSVCFTPVEGDNIITLICYNECGVDTCQTIIHVALNSPPVAQCTPGMCPPDTIFVCDLSELCLPSFTCSDADGNLESCEVTPGYLSGDSVCFTPVEGVNWLTLITTDSCGAADTCKVSIQVELNSPPEASCPLPETLFVCSIETTLCIDGFNCD
ncbi:MAG: hypothetical protein ACE5K8_04890, partial [Candidatus Zixiibacteriota bacterium]